MVEPKGDDGPFPRIQRVTRFLRRWGGAIALGGAVVWITGEALSWSSDAHAVRQGAHLRELGEKLLAKELDELHREEIEDALPDRLADHYWEQHLRMVAGTPREAPARALREGSRRHRSERRAKIVRDCATRVDSALLDGRPLAAASALFLLPAGAQSSPESQELFARVDEEILRATGMTLVRPPNPIRPGSPNGNNNRVAPEARAFLLTERPVSTRFLDGAALSASSLNALNTESVSWKSLIEATRRDAIDDGPGVTGVTFIGAQEIAARAGLRLPHSDELEAARQQKQWSAGTSPTPGGTRERARVEWEWALLGTETLSATNSLALCVRSSPGAIAGARAPESRERATDTERNAAISAQRRHSDRGYPDVGFRLALDFEEAVRREREALPP